MITESRAGNDGLGVTVTPGTVAYVTTGGESFENSLTNDLCHLKTLYLPFRVFESASYFLFLLTPCYNFRFGSV